VELATGIPFVFHTCWSPDGKQIAFVSQEQQKDESINNIYTMPAEGGSPRKVNSESDNIVRAQMAWSPDGKTIAVSALQGGEPEL
jgi:Tol biopolymer transport system component